MSYVYLSILKDLFSCITLMCKEREQYKEVRVKKK